MGATGHKFDYSEFINADYINVKIDDTLYENIPKTVFDDSQNNYGNPDYLTSSDPVPFLLSSTINGDNYIYGVGDTQEISVTVSIPSKEEVTTTPCFDKARGYSCTETSTVLTEESVVAENEMKGLYAGDFQFVFANEPPKTLSIIFNGVKYDCNRTSTFGGYVYGGFGESAPDFSTYPFFISVAPDELTQLVTNIAGTYSVKLETVELSAETSECFRKAVRSAGSIVVEFDHAEPISDGTSDGARYFFNKTFNDVADALYNGVAVYARQRAKNGTRLSFNSASLLPIFAVSPLPISYEVYGFNINRNSVEPAVFFKAESPNSVLYVDVYNDSEQP